MTSGDSHVVALNETVEWAYSINCNIMQHEQIYLI